MSKRTCPRCRADLDDDLPDSTGAAECPFCGANVSDLYAGDFDSGDAGRFGSDTGDRGEPGAIRVPDGSRIQLVEADERRLVVVIPPGGKGTAGIGCFALLWNGLMTLFTGAMVAAVFGGQDDIPIFAIVLVGVFWAVGIGMAYAWFRMRNMTTYLLLERDRVAVQRVLFGRKWVKETTLTPESRAELAVAYEQNDEPVHHVKIQGVARKEKFGLGLGDEEKAWFVRTINEFLHGPEPDAETNDEFSELSEFGNRPIEAAVDPLVAADLPADSPIRVDADFVHGLRFSLPMFHGAMRTGCTVGCGTIGLVWIGVCAAIALGGDDWFDRVFPMLFSVAGFVFLMVSLAVRWGRIVVTIDDARLTVRWKVGPFGHEQTAQLERVTGVGLGTTYESRTNGRVTNRALGGLVRVGGKSIPLTTNHGEEIGRQAAGLVRHELERRGVDLEEVPRGGD